MPKLEKAAARDRKQAKRQHGMRVSGTSVRLLARLSVAAATKGVR